MSILHNKRVVILGLGNHGGGVASAHFAYRHGASQILISDRQSEKQLAPALTQLQDILSLPHVSVETSSHSIDKIESADIVIKNPAIPRTSDIIRMCIERGITIETDISLFLRELIAHKSTPTGDLPLRETHNVIVVTGTKGKSSITHAMHRWNMHCGVRSACAGNIAYPVLQLLMDKDKSVHAMTIILELSSFQLGDLQLVQKNNPSCFLYAPIGLAVLSNILPDHQNYYESMRMYAEDKLSLFRVLPRHVCKILPYELRTSEYSEQLPIMQDPHDNTIMWHSQTPLPENMRGAWANDDSIVRRTSMDKSVEKICTLEAISKRIPPQNSVAFALCCAVQNQPCPHTMEQWDRIFTIPHRKEYVRKYKGRIFYNDSAASIPQAMQLPLFQERKDTHVHVIAGGTDKNLSEACFLTACHAITFTHLSVYFLDGTYTQKIMPLIHVLRCAIFGPFASLEESVQSALHHSNAGDVIALSPGCASFGSFINEFYRGDFFKKIVHAL